MLFSTGGRFLFEASKRGNAPIGCDTYLAERAGVNSPSRGSRLDSPLKEGTCFRQACGAERPLHSSLFTKIYPPPMILSSKFNSTISIRQYSTTKSPDWVIFVCYFLLLSTAISLIRSSRR